MNMVAIHTAHLLKTSSHKTIVSLLLQRQQAKLREERKAREREEAIHQAINAQPIVKALHRNILKGQRRQTRTIAR